MTDCAYPNVIVLLAVHNGSDWLNEQLHTIMHQRDVALELYISNDHSTDDSLAICRRWAEQDARIHLLPPPPHSGCTGNFFHLIRSVDLGANTYLALADQDDLWEEDKLKRGIDQLLRHQADGYSANVNALWPNGTQTLIRKDYPQRKADFLFESPGPGCTFVFTRHLATAIQAYLRQQTTLENHILIHDWFLYAWARSRQYRWTIDARPVLLYRQHNRNTIGANHGIKALISRLRQVLTGPVIKQMVFQAQQLYPDQRMPVPLNGRRTGWLRLVRHATHCRRRPRDRWLLALTLLVLAVWPTPRDSD